MVEDLFRSQLERNVKLAMRLDVKDTVARTLEAVIEDYDRYESPDWLGELTAALGWQGGTVHDAIAAVARLVASAKEHHPPRRDTPMTVQEVSSWVMTTSDWEPAWCNIRQANIIDGGSIEVTEDGVLAAEIDAGVFLLFDHATPRLFSILDRICRETGWGGR